MNKKFNFPMKKTERILGCVYIPVHGFILPLLISSLIGLFAPKTGTPSQILIYYTVSFILTLIMMFSFLKTSFSDFIDGFWPAIQAIILGYVLYRALSWLAVLLLTKIMTSENPNTDAINEAVKLNMNMIVIVTAVLAPIVEESIFRGALFGTIRQKSRIAAYIVTVLVFAFYHIWQYLLTGFSINSLLLGIQYIPASVALIWCYERGGTIWAPILLHSAINLLATVLRLG